MLLNEAGLIAKSRLNLERQHPGEIAKLKTAPCILRNCFLILVIYEYKQTPVNGS